ncbi:MAG: VOC family protein [Pseudomonadales bacterium]|nr:VOC family protein [Pseudomonadales bacterium]
MAWQARSIFHFVLPCTNVERSTDFYANFGFEVIKDNRDVVWPDFVGTNFAMKPGAQGRAVQLVLPHGSTVQTRIDLIEWIAPRWQNENDGRDLESRIPRIMALRVENIQEAYNDLIGRGLVSTAPLRDPDPVIGVQGVVCFQDPDGHIVELIEYFGEQLGSRTDDLPTRSSTSG